MAAGEFVDRDTGSRNELLESGINDLVLANAERWVSALGQRLTGFNSLSFERALPDGVELRLWSVGCQRAKHLEA